MIIQDLDELWRLAERSERPEYRATCPSCGRGPTDKTFSLNPIKRVAHCFRCGFSHKGETNPDWLRRYADDLGKERERRQLAFERIQRSTRPIERGDLVDRYLSARLGCELPQLPHVGLGEYPRRTIAGKWEPVPAMVCGMRSPAGRVVAWHITMLQEPGEKLCGDARRFCKRDGMKGSAIRLYSPGATLIVAEGVETALALNSIQGDPVWAVSSASLLKSFEPPECVQHLVIAGDNDANGAGQEAAWALYDRLRRRLTCSVMIPDRQNADWLDEVRAER